MEPSWRVRKADLGGKDTATKRATFLSSLVAGFGSCEQVLAKKDPGRRVPNIQNIEVGG